MTGYWKVIWSAPAPAHGDEAQRRGSINYERDRVCTRFVRGFFDGSAVQDSIPGSRLVCCLGGEEVTVRESTS